MLNVAKLRELMKEMGVRSIVDISERTKIPYSTLNYMLQGHDMQVSTLVELSKFFEVPVDYLIKKSYGIVTYTEDGEIYHDTTSLIEATVSSMM